jgi:Subtilase family
VSTEPSIAVVLVDPPRYLEVVKAVDDIVDTFGAYRALPLLSLPLDLSRADDVESIEGVDGIEVADPSLQSMLAGLDEAALLMAGLSSVWGCGGVAPGDTYPQAYGEPAGSVAPPAVCAAVNLSLRPTNEHLAALRPNDSINHVTKYLSAYCVPVVAAGNNHTLAAGYETVSPWAEPPWVLAVGATVDPEGTQEADYSARGSRANPDVGPDILAWGASALNTARVGTSFAAARASRFVVLARAWLLQLNANLGRIAAEPFGVPLVGVAVVDKDFYRTPPAYSSPVDWRALPVMRANVDEAGPLEGLGEQLVQPSSPRRLVESAARSTSAANGASAPSLTADAFLVYLDELTFETLYAVLGLDPSTLSESRSVTIFPPGTGRRLDLMLDISMPIWEWEVPTNANRQRHD